MASKRMFNMKIVDSDAFLDMPLSTQCLYFHLNMRADDDGFIGNPKRIKQLVGASDDDLKLLIAKRFIITFENGVIVIKHWRMHNTLSKQRYRETSYLDEKRSLKIKENGSYSMEDGQIIDDRKLVAMYSNKKSGELLENTDIDIDLDIDIVNNISANCDPICDTDRVEVLSQSDVWFTTFWKAYPKKKDKANAQKAFNKKCKDDQTFNQIMDALIAQKDSKDWQKQNGQFIPYPTTWLNGERWKDEDLEEEIAPF